MIRVPALAAVVVLASAVLAVAEDSPGLALAKQVVEAARGDAHREKMRIVWPESVETAPPEGAEVTLIDGYISYGLTRIAWREGAGKLDVCQLFATRTWFYNKDGESFGARKTTIDASKFAVAWAAARYVLGAHDERLEPEPKDHPWISRGGSASHESHKWVRLRTSGADGPLHVSDKRGSSSNWENVVAWDDIRDGSVFKLFEPFIPPRESPTSAPSPEAIREVVGEIERAPSGLDLRYKGEHHLLMEVCLPLAGEFGDAATLKAVDALAAAIDTAQGADDYTVRDLREEIEMARTKLRLRTAWDPAEAATFLRGNTHQRNWQEDLDRWARARWRATNPEGYMAFLVGEATRTDQQPAALEASLAALREVDAPRADAALRDLLKNESPDVRIAAARVVLAADRSDEAAAAALVAVGDDRKIADLRTRTWALRSAKGFGVLDGAAFKKRLADPHPEHAYVVETLVELVKYSSAPGTDEEVLAAWRRVCDGPVEFGVAKAVDELLDLEDRASKERILAALERLEAALKTKAAGTDDLDAAKIARFRERLDELLVEPPPK